MDLGMLVDVGVGLAIVFLIVAMTASAAQEFIATALSVRGRCLIEGIVALLTGQPQPEAGLFSRFMAFLNVLVPAKPRLSPAEPAEARIAEAVTAHPLVSPLGPAVKPSYVAAGNFVSALFDAMKDGSGTPAFSQVENVVATLPPSRFRSVMETFVREAAGDIVKLRATLEKWFDDSMDRVSGVYKRWAHRLLFAIGLALAVALNLDAIAIARSLADSAQARQAMTAMARAMTEQHPDGIDKVDPTGYLKQLQAMPLPIGWSAPPWTRLQELTRPGGLSWAPVWTLIGWLITAAAASLGGPFWFDLIGKVMNPRGAGQKPARADQS